MLNFSSGRPARLHYLMGNFRLLTPGDHVVCAVTGEKIPLDMLRYWSVEKQEPYASAEIAARANPRK